MYYFIFPLFDPVFFSFYDISFRWYSLMYLISFIFTQWLVKKRIKYFFYSTKFSKEKITNLIYICFIGMVVGGRIGYVLFYNFSFFCSNPSYIFKIWNGGMSFHGGLLGVIVVIFCFSFRKKCCFFYFTDLLSPIVPFGLGVGRLGNFINGELWGKVSINNSLAMFFPSSLNSDIKFLYLHPELNEFFKYYGMFPRHPSQLYELFFEGVLLFIILNIFIRKIRPVGSVSGLFLIIYGVFRIFVEFYREPDYLYNDFSMGQILSFPMVFFGVIIMIWSYYPLRRIL
ncbi:Prolipoprotein diacylglyceryl transferase [Candidatus Westeberhardia cardiocondylae]|uniref:Phosphatidylglycerol--prolipoprotein diacylglyceryl transferase n=1 Tax=Candidatus Westeberhardia cardiocondylae TaxID=1594731 RepID=A0A0H5BWI5_9ENTR|nr:prolipoprotein diacylglyceryl transferase [Candidatus Westeberhardia cardiocondylae]CEN31988.1 Prolipoprotein diacylglyceryl transferase [Candidatus Westeberhardia cardiocondylae]